MSIADGDVKGLENQALGKYELIRAIGEGSMGTVYLARDSFSLHEVAVKVSSARSGDDPRLARRRRKLFFTEAKMAGMLHHPNILATIDAGVEDDLRYLVMEYIPGAQTLDRFGHADELLPMDQAVGIILKCALALGYAHEHGVIHRDVKPRNILLTQDNEVKVGDFGIALIARDDVEETQVIGRLGSPRYMSPEQVRDESVTPQSDIFSLGVVAYELLTGVHPFDGKTIALVARRISREPHLPARVVRQDLPVQLSHIIDRTLKKHPAGRYRSAVDLAGDLSLIHDELRYASRSDLGFELFHGLRKMRFFDGFEDSEIEEVVEAGTQRQFVSGERIVVEGESGDAFYILLSGDADVCRAGSVVAVVVPGTSFGEAGLFTAGQRTATIAARGPVSVLEVRASLLDRVSVGCQLRFHRAFLRTMAERLCATMDFIAREARGNEGKRS
jgi:serine/threonine protein kinase